MRSLRTLLATRLRAPDSVSPAGGSALTSEESYRTETRAELLNETLQVANYSAVTHVVVVFALAYMFWDTASHIYLAGLMAAISLIVAATLFTTWYYRNTFRSEVTETAVRHGEWISKGLALALGLTWATMPAILIPPSDGGHRMLAVAVTAGLISDAYVVGPFFSVALLLAGPIVAGGFIGLAGCEAPFGAYVSVMLAVYALFVCFSVRRMAILSYQRIWHRVVVQHQGETIGLLLNDFEEGASDWLWETDPEGRLRHVPARMAATLSHDPAALRGVTLLAILRGKGDAGQRDAGAAAVLAAMAARAAFRDHAVRVTTADGTRWWSLNGKPAFDRHGNFLGYRGVGSDTTISREAQARIAFLAGHDTLTGLPNRAAFQDAIHDVCRERGGEPGGPLGTGGPDVGTTLLCLDLDGFKAVNDSRGHAVGDQLLADVAQQLTRLTEARARTFRLGGDEFAILLPDQAGEDAERLARQVIAELRRPYQIRDAHLEIGVSIGIAHAPRDAQDPASLLSRADLALYSAKAAGKGCWRRFEMSLEDRGLRQRQLDQDMRTALRAGEMVLHYQPLIDLRSERVVGFEALLRWHRPEEGWISPAEIIAIAEGTGFIVEIGRWALARACTDALAWPGLRVAVNISSIHVRGLDFHDEVARILRETGLPPENLEIEITESVLLDREAEVLTNLKRLRALGVRIALDDFGTGYSSLSYLTDFPFDKVKVDRSFVRDLQFRPEKIAVVEAIATMARALSMDVTVEGVETRQQEAVLRHKHCGTAQGFLYSPARPASEIAELIRRLDARKASVA
ncbi:putative bifunctional diguanylate cyclase/phosphodiesterase [Methylobacterium sp. J-068]|uniref:putative bifunctional diguanylate cyclase/phosphodiesterase n=1 Tax=Methylobacterium sp. J-068 TaxID=2836649 RepID=UPI001FB87369|nr:EAL domain-containing protein [Methylobacterium sp. J-068]MCJ2036951.1 EAL domain-containing protein [Methylobacterium sp. J-068]